MQIPAFLENWSVVASRGYLTWLPHVVTTNDIPRSKPYTMVIFPVAFIFSAYEEDSALNHMLTWYKVISAIGQSKFEV